MFIPSSSVPSFNPLFFSELGLLSFLLSHLPTSGAEISLLPVAPLTIYLSHNSTRGSSRGQGSSLAPVQL